VSHFESNAKYVLDLLLEIDFEERFILRTYDLTVNGEKVTLPRGKWDLTPDAIPTIFPNLPQYLSTKVPKKRCSRSRCMPAAEQTCTSTQLMTPIAAEYIVQEPVDAQEMDTVYMTDEVHKVGLSKNCKILRRKVCQLRRMLRLKQGTVRHLQQQVVRLKKEVSSLKGLYWLKQVCHLK